MAGDTFSTIVDTSVELELDSFSVFVFCEEDVVVSVACVCAADVVFSVPLC